MSRTCSLLTKTLLFPFYLATDSPIRLELLRLNDFYLFIHDKLFILLFTCESSSICLIRKALSVVGRELEPPPTTILS